jgi:hypothetical protein
MARMSLRIVDLKSRFSNAERKKNARIEIRLGHRQNFTPLVPFR